MGMECHMETANPLDRYSPAKTREWRKVTLKMLREEIIPADRREMRRELTLPLQDHMRVQLIRSLTKGLPPALGEPVRRLLWEARVRQRGAVQ